MNEDWYQAAGFAIIGWALIAVVGTLSIKGKGQEWYSWACGAIGALSTLASGTYVARIGVVRGVVHYGASHPLLAFILFIVILVVIFRSSAMLIPDQFHSLSFGVAAVMSLVLLPALAEFVPGDFGDQVISIRDTYSKAVRDEAGNLFKPHGDQPGAVHHPRSGPARSGGK